MKRTSIIQKITRASIGLVAAGMLAGPAVSAATPMQPVQLNSAVTPLDMSHVGVQPPPPDDRHDRRERYERRGDMRFLELINVARARPELYPPHGEAQGAARTACATPLQYSPDLRRTARAHNHYLASRPIEWVNTPPNMHKNPNGKLAGDAGEPMDLAGYKSHRAEIVATGFPTSEAALQFWMQDDAPSRWGHRNNILNCAIKDAGPSRFNGGPGNQYYTVDMGTR
jgi:hypothetical protein